MKLWKKTAYLLSFLMIFAIVFGNVSLTAAADNGGLIIKTEYRDGASGSVTCTFLDEPGAAVGDPINTAAPGTTDNVPFPENTKKVKIKVSPGLNSQVGNYQVMVNGAQLSGTSKENAVSAGDTITVDTSQGYEVNVEFVSTSGGGGDPVPAEAISFVVEGNCAADAMLENAVEYSTDGGNSWNKITSSPFGLDPSVENAKIKVTDSTGKWMLQSFDIPNASTMTSGTAYSVTEKKQYHIQIDKKVYTVIWNYDSSQGVDSFVEHGKVEIVSAVASDEMGQWSGIEQPALPGENNMQQDDRGGRFVIKPGSTVTVKIVPDYGYQFVAGTLNGTVITPGTEMSTFTFTMPSAQLHLSALFTESADKTLTSAAGVSGARIQNGGNAIQSGNLELTVADSAITDAGKETLLASSAAADVTVSQWLAVDLKQIVNKGNQTDVWEKPLTELNGKVTIVLTVGTGLDTNRQYVVVREHNGAYEKIPATYNPTAGTLTFQSDKFSEYAVGTMPVNQSSNNGGSGSSQNPPAAVSGSEVNTPTEKQEEKVLAAEEYTVVKGDTLGKIARNHHMTLSVLLSLNPQIKNPNRIYPGQKIITGYTEKLVDSSLKSVADAEYYIVQRGDSLYKIARKNKLTLSQVYTLNPEIKHQKYIFPGQKIRIK